MSSFLAQLFGPWLPWAIVLCVLLAAEMLYGDLWVRTVGRVASISVAYEGGSLVATIGFTAVVAALLAYPFK